MTNTERRVLEVLSLFKGREVYWTVIAKELWPEKRRPRDMVLPTFRVLRKMEKAGLVREGWSYWQITEAGRRARLEAIKAQARSVV